MADINETIILSKNRSMADKLAARIGPMAHHIHRADTPDDAMASALDKNPDAIFIDLDEDPQSALTLTRRIRHRIPSTAVMGVAREKNADLIIAGMRAGLTDYLVFPDNGNDILPALRNALGRNGGSGGTGEIMTVFSLKGGQGVTSVAVNLCDHIHALTGRKTLLLDLNLYRGDAAVYLNQTCTYTPFDVLRDRDRMDERLLFSSLVRHKNRFYLLGTAESINDADQIGAEDVIHLVDTLKPYFSYIVVDLPSDFSAKNLALFNAADRIVLMAQQTLPEIKSAQSVLDFFKELFQDAPKTNIVVNRYQKNQEISVEDLSDIFNHPVTATIANDYRTLSDAIKAGKTIATADNKTRINRDFEKLAARLTGISPAPTKVSMVRRVAGMLWG